MNFADLSIETAKRHVGDTFLIEMADGSALPLALTEASRLATGPGDAAAMGLSLTFHGPSEPVLGQGTYGLSHGDSEPQAVFLVPVANDADSTSYEAIFTRL